MAKREKIQGGHNRYTLAIGAGTVAVVYPVAVSAQTFSLQGLARSPVAEWLTLLFLILFFSLWLFRERTRLREQEDRERRRVREALFRIRRELWGNHAKLVSRFDAFERTRVIRNAVNFAFFETNKVTLSSAAYDNCDPEVLGSLPLKLVNLIHHTYATLLNSDIREEERLNNMTEIRRSFPDLSQVDLPADELEETLERWQAEIGVVKRSLQTVEKYLRVKPLITDHPGDAPPTPVTAPPPRQQESAGAQTAPSNPASERPVRPRRPVQDHAVAERQSNLSFAAE